MLTETTQTSEGGDMDGSDLINWALGAALGLIILGWAAGFAWRIYKNMSK